MPRHASTPFICATLMLAACHPADAGGGPQSFPPMQVGISHLSEKTITDFDEYLASLTSRRSITLYPQVAGYVRTIGVKSGELVKAGALLVDIDPGQQNGLLRSLNANLQTRKANLAFAVQNDESSQALLKAGVLGQLDFDQRHSARLSAEADVKAAEAQVQAQTELLRFYSIRAPIDGIIGDVPVKVGDYVEPQTRLTSIDQNKLVEAYVYVPIAKADSIKRDTTLQLVDESGRVVCEQKPTFISPQVSVDTQTVLVKTVCPNQGTLRAAQVLKARVIWSRHPGVTIPTVAVMRQSGQYFAYIAEHSGQGLVARQRPIEVGPIVENEFVVTKGLEAGTDIVTSAVQKIRDGAPIAALQPSETSGVAAGH